MIVAVCGLHGGAGTTTVATLLASAAAAQHPGGVLLCDSAPGTGDLAHALGAASPHNITDLAHMTAAGQTPTQLPWLQQPAGLRVVARTTARRPAATADAIAMVLTDAAVAHALVVVDAGALHSEHATGALHAADVVLWSIDATAQLQRCAAMLSSPLAAEARRARWLLTANATGRTGDVPTAAHLAQLAPTAARLVLVPAVGTLPDQAPARQLAASQLLSALLA